MNKVYINVNSLNVSYIEFETIVWNVTKLDDVKLRKYITNEFEPGDKVILQLINFLSDYMDQSNLRQEEDVRHGGVLVEGVP